MPKKLLSILIAVVFLLGITKFSFAMMCHGGSQQGIPGQEQTAESSSEHRHQETDTATQVMPDEAVNVGNKICPVSGEKIDEKTKAIYEYERKIYNFCCAKCVEDFKKDPQKYIKKVEEELQAEPKEGMAKEKETMPEGEPSHSMHEGHQHSR